MLTWKEDVWAQLIFIDFVRCVFYAMYVIHDCLLHMKIL